MNNHKQNDELAYARDYVQKRIEECQWQVLLKRLDGLEEPVPQPTSFLGISGSVSRAEPRFCGVLWLGDPDHGYHPRDTSAMRAPPMPLTLRNKLRLETMGFVVSECGYWALFRESQVVVQ